MRETVLAVSPCTAISHNDFNDATNHDDTVDGFHAVSVCVAPSILLARNALITGSLYQLSVSVLQCLCS